MSPTAPFLAPERDEKAKRGRAKSASTTYYSMPGVAFLATGTEAPALNSDVYAPFFVDTPILVDQLAGEVTILEAAKNIRWGIYRSDANWQPTGAPLVDSGDISTASTGVKTFAITTPLYLSRGRYLAVSNTTATGTAQVRRFNGSVLGATAESILGANPFSRELSVTRTYAAFPTPGTAWTASTADATGNRYKFLLRVSTP